MPTMPKDKDYHPQQQQQNGQRHSADQNQPARAGAGWTRLCSTSHLQGKIHHTRKRARFLAALCGFIHPKPSLLEWK